MTGPEHYQAGERALAAAGKQASPDWAAAWAEIARGHFAAAQAAVAAEAAGLAAIGALGIETDWGRALARPERRGGDER